MKKIFALILAVIIALGLAACGTANGSATDGTADTASDAAEPVVDQNITAEEATGDFAMTTSDGTFTSSGNVYTITSAGDGFQTAHNFEMTAGEEGTAPTVTVYTGSYSGYTASSASTTSYKGIKVRNELNIKDGTVTLQTYDDGLHADYGTSFDDGTKGSGTVSISGGTVNMTVYAPENKTAGGRHGPGGWGGQQTVSGADAIHADNVLNITGGTLIVLGYGRVSKSGSVRTVSLSLHSSGSHTVKIDGTSYTFTNANSYGATTCYSDATVSS